MRVPTPRLLWERSLPFRVVVITVLATVGILMAAGVWLLMQSTQGIVEAKTSTSIAEATSALRLLQNEVSNSDTRATSPYEQVGRLAQEAAARGQVGNQYFVLVETSYARIGSDGLAAETIPEALRAEVAGSISQPDAPSGLWSTPTTVRFADGRPDEPGLVVAGVLSVTENSERQSYPVYFVFPTTAEQQTLDVVRGATIAAGLLLLALVAVTVYLVARMVLRPVRAAAVAAERLASGHLEDRMAVTGSSDLASLATSMNNMAGELDRKITELTQLSTVQQRFVSDVSHELRTPMTTIRMATDVIDSHRGQLDPQAARSSELLSQEVGRFEALLAELLEVSRFDAGAATLNPDDINLAKLTADEIRGVLPLAQGSGSQVSLNAPDEEMAELDGTRVRRIVRNLLTNAIEHGEGGPVEVSLAGNETSVALTVRDYGVGLSEADVRQVFDRFWRADPARNRRIGGIGLGLAIAQEDARLHGGRLGVWGAPGVGAQFRLWLPRKAGGPLGEPPLPLAPADGEGVEYEP